jgi:hypothetical protein
MYDRGAQLYPQVPGSHFAALYESQGYGGGILTRLHPGNCGHYTSDMKQVINTTKQSPSYLCCREIPTISRNKKVR